MDDRCAAFDALGLLLAYPGPDYHRQAERCCRLLEPIDPEAARRVGVFAAAVAPLSAEELEELYTRTFDLNPICSLEVGWQLFGENYARGDFLVQMRQELRRLGLAESCELPDHLTHVLPLLGRLETEHAEALAGSHVLPALDKMLTALAGKGSPYETLLQAACALLAAPAVAGTPEVHHG